MGRLLDRRACIRRRKKKLYRMYTGSLVSNLSRGAFFGSTDWPDSRDPRKDRANTGNNPQQLGGDVLLETVPNLGFDCPGSRGKWKHIFPVPGDGSPVRENKETCNIRHMNSYKFARSAKPDNSSKRTAFRLATRIDHHGSVLPRWIAGRGVTFILLLQDTRQGRLTASEVVKRGSLTPCCEGLPGFPSKFTKPSKPKVASWFLQCFAVEQLLLCGDFKIGGDGHLSIIRLKLQAGR